MILLKKIINSFFVIFTLLKNLYAKALRQKRNITKFIYILIIVALFLFVYNSVNTFIVKQKLKSLAVPNVKEYIEELKYEETYPDAVFFDGIIKSDLSDDSNIKVEYKKLYSYRIKNLHRFHTVYATIYKSNTMIYEIFSDIAYTSAFNNPEIIYLEGNSKIIDYEQLVTITGNTIKINLATNEIWANEEVIVLKDSIKIKAMKMYAENTTNKVKFSDNVIMENDQGIFENKEIKELKNMRTVSDTVDISLKDNAIVLRGNCYIITDMVEINGEIVSVFENEKEAKLKIQNGDLTYRNENNNESSLFYYSKGSELEYIRNSRNKENKFTGIYAYSYYLEKRNDKSYNEIFFSGNKIDIIENKKGSILGNGYIYDSLNCIFIKGNSLFYNIESEYVRSNTSFILHQFRLHYNPYSKTVLSHYKPIIDYKNNIFRYLENTIPITMKMQTVNADKGIYYSRTKSFQIDGNIEISDFDNLMRILCQKLMYSGSEKDEYTLEEKVWIEQYDNLQTMSSKINKSIIMQGNYAYIQNKERLCYLKDNPKILNLKEDFFIQAEVIDIDLEKEIYQCKNDVKLITKSEDKQIMVLGDYAIYYHKKNYIIFNGASKVIQNNNEIHADYIYVDIEKKEMHLKGLSDTTIIDY